MSNKWRGLQQPITAELAEREPEHLRLFGTSFRARRAPAQPQRKPINKAELWKKPMIIRPK